MSRGPGGEEINGDFGKVAPVDRRMVTWDAAELGTDVGG